MYLNEYESEESNLGLLKKLRKLHKKVTKPISKIEKKVLPKKLRKIHEKHEKAVDKLAANKTLNKVANVAAAAVATYVTGGAAAGTLQAALVGAGKKAVVEEAAKKGVKKIKQRRIKKDQKREEKRLRKEIAQLESGLNNPSELSPEQRAAAAKLVAQETATLRAATNNALPVAVAQLPSEVQSYIAQRAQSDPNWLKTPEALQLMEPAIKSASSNIAAQVSNNPLAPEAAEKIVDDAVDRKETESSIKNLLIPLGVITAGAIVLYAMNRRK